MNYFLSSGLKSIVYLSLQRLFYPTQTNDSIVWGISRFILSVKHITRCNVENDLSV